MHLTTVHPWLRHVVSRPPVAVAADWVHASRAMSTTDQSECCGAGCVCFPFAPLIGGDVPPHHPHHAPPLLGIPHLPSAK